MLTCERAAGWKWPQPVGLTEINPNSNDLDFSVQPETPYPETVEFIITLGALFPEAG